MNMHLNFLATLLLASIGSANEDDRVGSLTSKVVINSQSGFYTLSDGSLWKVYSFTPRWRSVSEWWNDVKLAPSSYECQPDDFYLGSDLQILSKQDHELADQENASNKEVIARCTHLIHNVATDKYLYAVSLRPENLITELYNDSFKDGYQKGLEKGQLLNNIDASVQYEKGYDAGFYKGYKEAMKAQEPKTQRHYSEPAPSAPAEQELSYSFESSENLSEEDPS